MFPILEFQILVVCSAPPYDENHYLDSAHANLVSNFYFIIASLLSYSSEGQPPFLHENGVGVVFLFWKQASTCSTNTDHHILVKPPHLNLPNHRAHLPSASPDVISNAHPDATS
jgi:hypothetical protein